MRRGITLLFIQLIASIAFFIATVIIARYLGPEDFGDFSAAYSVASVAYMIALLGADVIAMNVIAVSIKAQKKGQIKAFIIYVFIIVTLLSIFYYIIAIFTYWLSKNIFVLKYTHPVFVAVIFIPIMALTFFFYRVFISLSKPILANALFKILINFSMLFLASLMFFVEAFRSSHVAVILFMVAWIITFVVMLFILAKRMRVFIPIRDKIEYKSWLNSGLSGLPYTLALFTLPYLAIIGAEVFLANEDSVGIFATAASFSQVIANNFIACIQSVALAPIAIAIYNKRFIDVKTILNKNFVVTGGLCIVLMILIFFFGKDFLLIYGEKYTSGSNILTIFIITQSIILVGCLAAPVLLYLKKNTIVFLSSVLLIFFLIIFISVLGYVFQEKGLAIGVLLAVFTIFLFQNIYAYRLTSKT
ncbi:oligosaccharide flippase family protein [Francisella sp. SYW-9]|uniref:oligosaccharide flippase family protein n=1 Tax=Francisella sp. SYW-9 TaxID=2610888 RepID=UPI00123DD2CB|nr:oligosaccharide flippase family protein [Francisella sp. SYW-9]